MTNNPCMWTPPPFYQPNMSYIYDLVPGFDGMILAIPGNHDGEVRVPADQPSLSAYWTNFCADPGTDPPLAASYKVVMPNQPGAYWYLDAPFVDVIGLYSNSGENYGLLGQNDQDTHQAEWLEATLKTIASGRAGSQRKALHYCWRCTIPYNRGLLATGFGHGGSHGCRHSLMGMHFVRRDLARRHALGPLPKL